MDNSNFNHIEIANYDIIKTIGTGAYGRVYFVRDKNTKKAYALKTLRKSKWIYQNQISYCFSEYSIWKIISHKHPFIVSLNAFKQDKKYIYFVLDFIPGGEWFTLMRSEINFTPNNTRFYIAQLIEVFIFLHSLNIIYRDLKPENILLDSTGYIRWTDFGVSKIIEDKTYTLCGTPNYLAPEMIMNKGYTFSADWWAIGVLTYEMIVGIDPWDEKDPMMIYEKIKKGKILFPKKMDKIAKNFIQHCLVGDPLKRMGTKLIDGKNEIFKHKWFEGFNWEEWVNQKMTAWHIPKWKNLDDTSNYNDYPESISSEGEDLSSDWDPFISW